MDRRPTLLSLLLFGLTSLAWSVIDNGSWDLANHLFGTQGPELIFKLLPYLLIFGIAWASVNLIWWLARLEQRPAADIRPIFGKRFAVGNKVADSVITWFRTPVSETARQKQALLDEIADLRVDLGELRIGMEQETAVTKDTVDSWRQKFYELEGRIAQKIEAFSTKAEANIYKNRGNLRVFAGPNLSPDLQLLIRMAIHDLDHLKKFIMDYSRTSKS